ncbi:MAG TPA: polysaccharide biosynthesis tyrosine autokinase [Anaerolineales bacterium]|nr:polysaccharide biosynthesis tyrosine autokinase [Anaerolineales bacterium]
MEIRQYLSIARRWAWLLILGLALGTAGGYGFGNLQTPVYQTTTKIMVSSSPNVLASNTNSIYGDQQLAQTYVQLLTTQPMLDGVSEALDYPVSRVGIAVQQIQQGTPIIRITVENINPQRAADIANQLVQVLIEQNEVLQAGRYAASDESLRVQIEQVEQQIAKYQTDLDNVSTKSVSEQLALVTEQMAPLQAEVLQLQKDIALLSPTTSQQRKAEIAEKQARLDQIAPLLNLYQQIYSNLVVLGNPGANVSNDSPMVARLQSTLELYQQIYLNLINSRESIRLARLQNTPNVVQIEAAAVPTSPIRPQPVQNALLAGAVGLMLAAGIVFLVEYLDDTIRTPEDAERLLGLPLIGYVAEMQSKGKGDAEVYVSRQPRSPVSESFRSLRTNLEFSSVDKPLRTILITGAEAGDGKTTIAANLAAIVAQGGKRVLLLDADLRRPRLHRFLGIQNRLGLTDLFRDGLGVEAVTYQWSDANSKTLSVITSGSLPPNPAELLGSHKMNSILAELSGRADMVIIDSPPSIVADAQLLAAKVDGVLLVIQPGKTHAGAAQAMREQLDRAGAHIVGAVFNRIPRSHGYYYGSYHYYSPYYYQNDKYLTGKDVVAAASPEVIAPREKPSQSLLSRVWKQQSRSDK